MTTQEEVIKQFKHMANYCKSYKDIAILCSAFLEGTIEHYRIISKNQDKSTQEKTQ